MRVSYSIDQVAFNRVLKEEVASHQQLFEGDLREPLRQAARAVIYGNFTGKGSYSPREIGKFSGERARENRGWIESNYGSKRAYLTGGKRRKADEGAFSELRSRAVLDAVSQLGKTNPSLSKIAGEAARAALRSGDPLASRPPKEDQGQNLRGFLSSGAGKKLTRQAEPKAAPKANMRYGVQTGKLARAWYDLGVTPTGSRNLSFSLDPVMGSLSGSPDALKLTEYLSHNKGWKGLMDLPQLVSALKDQGVIVLE